MTNEEDLTASGPLPDMEPLTCPEGTKIMHEGGPVAQAGIITSATRPQRGRPVKLWIQEAVDESSGLCKYCYRPAPKNNSTKIKRVRA